MENRPKVLDLFCGAGGSAMGLFRAGFDVIGVDIKPQPHYPFPFIQADAMDIEFSGFDAYWASPPCQAWSARRKFSHPELIGPVREKLKETKKPYIIENIMTAPILNSIVLCGTMFEMNLFKHRLFESNCLLLAPPHIKHQGKVGDGRFISPIGNTNKKVGHIADWIREMGTCWMTNFEMSQAIPPAYAEFLGKQLLGYLAPSDRAGLVSSKKKTYPAASPRVIL